MNRKATFIKGLSTPSESSSESEKVQTTSKKDQRMNKKHQETLRFRFRFLVVWIGPKTG